MNVRPALADYPHDERLTTELRRRLAAGELDANVGVLRPDALIPGDVRDTREVPEALGPAVRGEGVSALGRGEVAVAILAGGMATRFGGAAKAAVPLLADDPTTFLAWQLARVADHRKQGARVPVVIIVSFATRDAVLAHLDTIGWGGVPVEDRHVLTQSLVPRHTADLSTALPDDPAIPDAAAYSAPGHGEVLTRLRESGLVARLREAGVRHVVVTNCDNIGATLDAAGVGLHLSSGMELSVEVVAREPGDKGGPIARVGGRPMIVEGFRLAADVDVQRFGWFNTNTLWFRAEALERPMALDWFAVRRRITLPDGAGLDVVQTEQLIGQATEHLTTCFLGVPRARRFVPIKTRDDLADAAAEIRRRLTEPERSER